jgi:tetratricopeptide (TPR) repeat protein
MSRFFVPAALAAFLLAGPAGAADAPAAKPSPAPAASAELDRCSQLAESDPDAALAQAEAWKGKGGGDSAEMCRALGLFHKRAFKPAAEAFAALAAKQDPANARGAAQLLARAGWAYLRGGEIAAAEKAYTGALARTPDDPDLHIDRAFARAGAGRYDDAVTDLDTVLALQPNRADALTYRAAAHRARKDYAKALADADRALALQPGDPETLLLRGNVRALKGDYDGAARDWKELAGQGGDSKEAKIARMNLDRLAAATKQTGAPPAAAPSASPGGAPVPVKKPAAK